MHVASVNKNMAEYTVLLNKAKSLAERAGINPNNLRKSFDIKQLALDPFDNIIEASMSGGNWRVKTDFHLNPEYPRKMRNDMVHGAIQPNWGILADIPGLCQKIEQEFIFRSMPRLKRVIDMPQGGGAITDSFTVLKPSFSQEGKTAIKNLLAKLRNKQVPNAAVETAQNANSANKFEVFEPVLNFIG